MDAQLAEMIIAIERFEESKKLECEEESKEQS